MQNKDTIKIIKETIDKHTNRFLILNNLPKTIAEDIYKTLEKEGVKKIPKVREWYL